MKINLGCGSRTLPGWVNVDRVQLDGVTDVWDLDRTPWPFDSNLAELIEARDVFEHVNEPIAFMTECHRILQRGGRLHIHTPYWRHPDAYTDPTHKRFPTEHTFDYWLPGTVLYGANNAAYGGVSFHRVDMHLDGGSLDITLIKP